MFIKRLNTLISSKQPRLHKMASQFEKHIKVCRADRYSVQGGFKRKTLRLWNERVRLDRKMTNRLQLCS